MGQDVEVVPRIINYQGKLTDAGGGPLGGAAGGTFRLRFQIYGQATGGAVVWAEEREVVVIGGLFNVALGSAGGTAVGAVSRDVGVAFAGSDRFLETTIVSGPGITAAQTLAPRQQLASVPFALVAQTTDRAAVAALAESLIPELTKALNPPGTIITYAGAVTDNGALSEPVPGYLLCNGAVIDATTSSGKYAALKTALAEAWGNGADANANTVNLPDLRGVFLRGWNGGADDGFKDPDVSDALRIARKEGGNTGDKVGSFQRDEFKNHNHHRNPRNVTEHRMTSEVGGGWGMDGGRSHHQISESVTGSVGGSETRPKNANVVYLIKY